MGENVTLSFPILTLLFVLLLLLFVMLLLLLVPPTPLAFASTVADRGAKERRVLPPGIEPR